MNRGRFAIGLWLVLVAACTVVIVRTSFTTDLSAFLPRAPTPAQQVLIDQLRDGVVSKLMLIGIGGEKPELLAGISKRMARDLRKHDAFVSVDNGDDFLVAADRRFVWQHRYLLSPEITPERFSPDAMRNRLRESLRILATPAGVLLRRILPADPTGEILALREELDGNVRPVTRDGVWFSREGARALLVARTRAPASDLDAQERAVNQVRDSFEQAAAGTRTTLVLTGPGVFSVLSRAVIKRDVVRFALLASCLIAALLLVLFRSPRVLVLSLVPVASGALAGMAAVSLGFGEVHGITLGFGVTLLGEGVDYAIYLFSGTAHGASPRRTLDRIWPTVRLGVLTSICGFSAMLLSGFSGLAQLGLFSITGLVVAAVVTREVLPVMMARNFSAGPVVTIAPKLAALIRGAPRLRYPLLALVVLSAGLLVGGRGPVWGGSLASLSPVSAVEQRLDAALRQDLGAPDVRHLIVIRAPNRQEALQASEAVVFDLRKALRDGVISGYDAPSNYLPSDRTQRERQAALPSPSQLRDNLQLALQGLPYRPGAFERFLEDVAAAKTGPRITRSSLEGTRLALKLDALLLRQSGGWTAMLPLAGVTDVVALGRAIRKDVGPDVVVLDTKRESERLYAGYRDEILRHSLLGAGAIVLLLFVSLRSAQRLLRVLAPLIASVIVVTCALSLLQGPLSIFHLIGLLLVVAVGSNYSLFFDSVLATEEDRDRIAASLCFACASTVVGFGVLSFSDVPVLNALGSTVGLGAVFALLLAAALRADKW